MNLILFGFKGAGKTTLGKKLAEMSDRPFIDTDTLLGNPQELYQTLGEKAFRKLEKETILRLYPQKASVIALGGGSVCDLESQHHLEKIGTLIYLKASFETLEKRIFKNQMPSYLDPQNPLQSLKAIYEERLPIYEKIPALIICVDAKEEETLIKEILDGI